MLNLAVGNVSALPRPVQVGIEATGSMYWFLDLLEELGECCAKINFLEADFYPAWLTMPQVPDCPSFVHIPPEAGFL